MSKLLSFSLLVVCVTCGQPNQENDKEEQRPREDNRQDQEVTRGNQADNGKKQPTESPAERPRETGKAENSSQPPPRKEIDLANLKPDLDSIQTQLINQLCLDCHNSENTSAKLNLADISRLIVREQISPEPGDDVSTRMINTPISDRHPIEMYHGKFIVAGNPLKSMFFLTIKSINPKDSMPPPASLYPRVPGSASQIVKEWILGLQNDKSR